MSTPTPLGPRPARVDRPRAAALRVLRALAEAAGPATIAGLTAALGGHPNTVRIQLDHLVDTGFATVTLLPPEGRGRPSQAYTATLAGQQIAGQGDERDDQPALIDAIAEHLAAGQDPRAAAISLGAAWGRGLAERDGAASDLAGVLARQGFAPEATDEGLRLRTCPLLDSARRHPEVVCAMHQGLIDATSPRPGTLLPFAAPGACLVRFAAPPAA